MKYKGVTVLDGTWAMGTGDRFDPAAVKPLGAGGFATVREKCQKLVIDFGDLQGYGNGNSPNLEWLWGGCLHELSMA